MAVVCLLVSLSLPEIVIVVVVVVLVVVVVICNYIVSCPPGLLRPRVPGPWRRYWTSRRSPLCSRRRKSKNRSFVTRELSWHSFYGIGDWGRSPMQRKSLAHPKAPAPLLLASRPPPPIRSSCLGSVRPAIASARSYENSCGGYDRYFEERGGGGLHMYREEKHRTTTRWPPPILF